MARRDEAKAASPADAVYERVREVCLAFPGCEEKLSHGAPSFHVRGKMFVMFVDDHHGDGRVGVWCKATLEEQRSLVASGADRYYVPPYVGVKGWIGIRLDPRHADWVDFAILAENGWSSVVPPSVVKNAAALPARKVPPAPVRVKTDGDVAKVVRERVTKIALALREAVVEDEGRHATFRVRKKPFAYFLDNHHGDGVICICTRTEKGENTRLVASEPKRFVMPQYIGARGWVGIRLEGRKVDWKDVSARLDASYRSVAPKSLLG